MPAWLECLSFDGAAALWRATHRGVTHFSRFYVVSQPKSQLNKKKEGKSYISQGCDHTARHVLIRVPEGTRKKKKTCSADEAWAWNFPKTWRFKKKVAMSNRPHINILPAPLWINPPQTHSTSQSKPSVYWHLCRFHAYSTSSARCGFEYAEL